MISKDMEREKCILHLKVELKREGERERYLGDDLGLRNVYSETIINIA